MIEQIKPQFCSSGSVTSKRCWWKGTAGTGMYALMMGFICGMVERSVTISSFIGY
jgi:hypothetical protein